jgi:hypothetical protein
MLRTAVIADYVTKDWTIDEIVFRIHGVIAMLHTAVGHSCSAKVFCRCLRIGIMTTGPMMRSGLRITTSTGMRLRIDA